MKLLTTFLISTLAATPVFGDVNSRFLDGCDDSMKRRIKNPSSYIRTEETKPILTPLTMEWYESKNDHLKYKESANAAQMITINDLILITKLDISDGHRVMQSIVSFSANNSFGVKSDSKFLCEYVIGAGDHDDTLFDPEKLYIDSRTHFFWLLKNMQ